MFPVGWQSSPVGGKVAPVYGNFKMNVAGLQTTYLHEPHDFTIQYALTYTLKQLKSIYFASDITNNYIVFAQ